MDPLQRLLAEREIERTIIEYAAANDAGDWERVAKLYAEDGRMNRPTAPGDFVEGRAAILAAFQARPPRTSRHVVANIRVDVMRDSAIATSQILLFTAAGQAPLVGTYSDKLVLTSDGWRFTERLGSLDFPH